MTFLASTGDNGADPGDGPNYPAVSPLVVAVGGTTLTLTKTNQWQSETGWSYGSDGFAPSAAGSGGISNFYPEPAFQEPYQSSGFRDGSRRFRRCRPQHRSRGLRPDRFRILNALGHHRRHQSFIADVGRVYRHRRPGSSSTRVVRALTGRPRPFPRSTAFPPAIITTS